MAAMIATEPQQRMSRHGPDLVVRNGVNWRPVRGYGGRWRGSFDLTRARADRRVADESAS